MEIFVREKQKDNWHPGAILREQIVNKNDLTLTKTAELLGISVDQLSLTVNGRCDITPNMCQRLAVVFNEDPEKWATMQAKHSVKMAEKEIRSLNLKPYKPDLG